MILVSNIDGQKNKQTKKYIGSYTKCRSTCIEVTCDDVCIVTVYHTYMSNKNRAHFDDLAT